MLVHIDQVMRLHDLVGSTNVRPFRGRRALSLVITRGFCEPSGVPDHCEVRCFAESIGLETEIFSAVSGTPYTPIDWSEYSEWIALLPWRPVDCGPALL